MNGSKHQLAEGILCTDFYQLTMAQVYWRNGMHELPAQFDYFFRSYPDYGRHKAGYCICAGLEWLLNWMEGARFGDEEIDYLATLKGSQGDRLFAADFLDGLRQNGDFAAKTNAVAWWQMRMCDVPACLSKTRLPLLFLDTTELYDFAEHGPVLPVFQAGRIRGQNLGRREAARHGVGDLGCADRGIRRCHKWVGTVINIQQAALRAFIQYALALGPQTV